MCTETPEKAYALADAYQKITDELRPITWDFSHFAVVKHLTPANFIEKLLIRPDLIQRAQQFHFRPFNGHHCQIPVTDGKGNLTQELKDWLPFAEAVLKCWLEGNRGTNREIFVCPEMGPVLGGYNLSTNEVRDKDPFFKASSPRVNYLAGRFSFHKLAKRKLVLIFELAGIEVSRLTIEDVAGQFDHIFLH